MKTIVSAGARIHLGLVDLTGGTGRRFGGIGAMLDNPRVTVSASSSEAWTVDVANVSSEMHAHLSGAVQRIAAEFDCAPAMVRVETALPEHQGLGSKTSTLLAGMKAISVHSGVATSDDRLRFLSQRGRTSGTGIHGFFTGGWIVDVGQRPEGTAPVPSSERTGSGPATLLRAFPSPVWKVGLVYAPGNRTFANDEVQFFKRNSIYPHEEVLRALAKLYHELIPALLEDDIDRFGVALHDYQFLSLKRREIGAQPPTVVELIEHLRTVYPVVGMSSMGPTLFVMSDSELNLQDCSIPKTLRTVETTISTTGWRYVRV